MISRTNNNIYYGTPPVKNENNDNINERKNHSEKTRLLNVSPEIREITYRSITTQEHYISQFTNCLTYLLNHEDSNTSIQNPRIFRIMASSITSYSFPVYSNRTCTLGISFTIDNNINLYSTITLQWTEDFSDLTCTIRSMTQDKISSSPQTIFSINHKIGAVNLLINIKEFFEKHQILFRSNPYLFVMSDANPAMENINLSGLRLRHSNFKNYNFSKSILNRTDLSFSNFSNTDMTGSNLSLINIIGTNFTKAKFDNIIISSPLLWLPAKWTPGYLFYWFKRGNNTEKSALYKIQHQHPRLDIYSSNPRISNDKSDERYNFLDAISSISDEYPLLKVTMMQEILHSFITQKTNIFEAKDNIANLLNLPPYCINSKIKRYRRQLCI